MSIDNYTIENALVTSARIELNDHGILDVWLLLERHNCSQGFGGYHLGAHVFKPSQAREVFQKTKHNYCGHQLIRIMQVCGVLEFSACVGRAIRIGVQDRLIKEIGHITRDDWYNPTMDFRE